MLKKHNLCCMSFSKSYAIPVYFRYLARKGSNNPPPPPILFWPFPHPFQQFIKMAWLGQRGGWVCYLQVKDAIYLPWSSYRLSLVGYWTLPLHFCGYGWSIETAKKINIYSNKMINYPCMKYQVMVAGVSAEITPLHVAAPFSICIYIKFEF